MKLFKVTLNLNGEVHVFYTHAEDPLKAKKFSLIRLALKIKMNKLSLFKHFQGEKDNFAIKEVKR